MPFIRRLREDIETILYKDPAARTRLQIILCYSGLHAIWFYRCSHWHWSIKLRLLARILSQAAKVITGIEIHPAAQIGNRLFIDHGAGVVIGETAVVGHDVTLYQGTTLGGTGKERGKRHPAIGNHVVVGAGSKILGNVRIGDGCRIGAGSVVLRDVPPRSTIVGVPGHLIRRNGKRVMITDPRQIQDPLSAVPAAALGQLDVLRVRIQKLEKAIERRPDL